MEVYFDKESSIRKIEFKGKLNRLLIKLKLNSETVIVVREGILLTEDDNLSNSDKLRILSVVSGG